MDLRKGFLFMIPKNFSFVTLKNWKSAVAFWLFVLAIINQVGLNFFGWVQPIIFPMLSKDLTWRLPQQIWDWGGVPILPWSFAFAISFALWFLAYRDPKKDSGLNWIFSVGGFWSIIMLLYTCVVFI